MTVKELIKKLSEFDPLMEVFFGEQVCEGDHEFTPSVEEVYTKEGKFKENSWTTDAEEKRNGTFAIDTVVILDMQ